MPRDVFPFQADKDCITAFLDGQVCLSDAGYELAAGADHKLRFAGDVVAWFDTSGALYVKYLQNWQFHYSRAIVQELMNQLGLKGTCQQEAKDLTTFGKEIRTMHYYIDDTPVALGDPHVLVGDIGMMAYRASRGLKV